MLKEYKVISNLAEFRHLNIAQIKFFMDKHEEYEMTKKKQKELNERLKKKNG